MGTEESPLQFLFRVANPAIEISQDSFQLAGIDSFRQIAADFEVIEPIVEMPHIQVVLLSQFFGPRPRQIPIDGERIIKRADLGKVHRCSLNIEHLTNLLEERLVGDDHLIIDQLLTVNVLLDQSVPVLAVSHDNAVLDLDDERKVALRQCVVGLIGISLVGKGRQVVYLRNFDEFGSVAERVQSIELAPCAFQGPVDIGGDDLNGIVSVLIGQELQIIDVILPQHLAEVLMLSHADCRKLAPERPSGIAVIVTVEMVPRAMAEHADHLLQLGLDQPYRQQKGQKGLEFHVRMINFIRNNLV